MKSYRITVSIMATGDGSGEHAEVQLGVVQADSISELVAAASKFMAVSEDQHNEDDDDAKTFADQPADDHAGS